jgi:two-component system response regulator HydG
VPKRLARGALDLLLQYDWPGNVRELENALEHAVLMARGEEIGPGDLPDRSRARPQASVVSDTLHANPTLDVIERAYILWVLQREGGNKTRAAEALGIDPSTLYRKLARYEGDAGS